MLISVISVLRPALNAPPVDLEFDFDRTGRGRDGARPVNGGAELPAPIFTDLGEEKIWSVNGRTRWRGCDRRARWHPERALVYVVHNALHADQALATFLASAALAGESGASSLCEARRAWKLAVVSRRNAAQKLVGLGK